MPKNFEYWKKQHDSEELKEFNSDRLGTLWLKIKSIVRREYINLFCEQNNITLNSTKLNTQFKELFTLFSENVDESHELLNKFISNRNTSELDELDTDKLEFKNCTKWKRLNGELTIKMI